MSPLAALDNRVLIAALLAWAVAQGLKMPIEYARTRRWNWVLLLRAGGMPSSHSSSVAALAHGIGLSVGYDSAMFALAVVVAMVVIYDATGIRRQSGLHAEVINVLVHDLLEGNPMRHEKQLREVLGHSPLEALVGLFLGLAVAQIIV
ncbi:MAG: divergent PAP2 family protein [Anaerolineales bacterium]|nr:MAG: divergent PAP2 family protein [Anaerolineales bacterium]